MNKTLTQQLILVFIFSFLFACSSFTKSANGYGKNGCKDEELFASYFNDYDNAVRCSRDIIKGHNDPELVQKAFFILGEKSFVQGRENEAFEYFLSSAKGPDCDTALATLSYVREMDITYDQIERISSLDTSKISATKCRAIMDIERKQWSVITGDLKTAKKIDIDLNPLKKIKIIKHIGGLFEEKSIVLPEISDSVDPSDFFAGTENSEFNYVYEFSVEEEKKAPILIKTGLPYKIFINGHLFYSRDSSVNNSYSFDVLGNFKFTKGKYTVVVKVDPDDSGGSFGIYIPDYSFLSPFFSNNTEDGEGVVSYVDIPGQSTKKKDIFQKYLEFCALDIYGRKTTEEDFLEIYSDVLGSRTLPLLYKAARTAYRNNNYTRTENILKTLVKKYPDAARPLLMLMTFFLDSNKMEELEHLRAKTPEKLKKYFQYKLFESDYFSFKGLYPNSLYVSENTYYQYREYPVSAIYYAASLEEFGSVKEALEQRMLLLHQLPYFIPLLEKSWELAQTTGDIEKEIAVLEKMMKVSPLSREFKTRLGTAHLKNRETVKAQEIFKDILAVTPDDVTALLAMGDIAVLNNDMESVVKYYGTAYSVSPENKEAERKAALLFDTDFKDFFNSISATDKEVFEMIAAKPSLMPDKPYEIMFDEGIQRIINQKMIKGYFRLAIKLNNLEGIRLFSEIRKDGDLIKARIIKKDGSVSNNIREEGSSIFFYELEPGDTIDYAYILSQETGSWLDSFNFVWYFGEFGIMNRYSKISFYVPPGMKINFFTQGDIKKKTVKDKDGGKIHVFKTENIFLPPKEELMPRDTLSVVPHMQISGVASWREFAIWQNRFINEGSVVTGDMIEIVKNIKETQANTTGIVASLRDYVAREISYTFSDSGIYLVKPEPSDIVFNRKSGDCKDKALLLKVLLKTADINSNYALVKSFISGEFRKELPYMQFDHALLYIPEQPGIEKGFFVDPTASYDYFKGINPEIEGSTAMVILNREDMYEFVEVKSEIKNSMTFYILGPDKESEVHFTGGAASEFRYHLYSGKTPDSILSEMLLNNFGAVLKISDIVLSGSPFDEPLKISFAADSFLPSVISGFFKKLLVSEERNYPVHFSTETRSYRFIIAIEENEEPPAFKIDDEFFTYTSEKIGNNTMKIDFVIKKKRIRAEEFAELKKSIIRIMEFEKKLKSEMEW